jgi:hypothetical protein
MDGIEDAYSSGTNTQLMSPAEVPAELESNKRENVLDEKDRGRTLRQIHAPEARLWESFRASQ